MNITQDPITGSEQKEGTYYARIWDVYKQKKPSDSVTRPLSSVQTRVKTMLKECVRFAACFKSVKDLRKSGYSYDDNVRLATAMFNKVNVSHPREDVGKPFRFEKCWELLRDMLKFKAAASGGSSGGSTDEGSSASERGSTGGHDGKDKKERPDGRRKAKEELAAQHVRAKKLKLAEKAVTLQEQQVEELTRRNEILLFSNGPGGCDSDMSREYFALKQAEALQKIKDRMRTTEMENATNLNLLGGIAEETEN